MQYKQHDKHFTLNIEFAEQMAIWMPENEYILSNDQSYGKAPINLTETNVTFYERFPFNKKKTLKMAQN